MSKVEVKRELKNWCLVHLCNEGGQTVELVVWGQPEDAPFHFVMTSPVRNVEPEVSGASALVHTVNSVYRLAGSGAQYHLPLAAATMLRQGYSPEDVTKFYKPAKPRELTEKEKADGIKLPGAPLLPDGLGTR